MGIGVAGIIIDSLLWIIPENSPLNTSKFVNHIPSGPSGFPHGFSEPRPKDLLGHAHAPALSHEATNSDGK